MSERAGEGSKVLVVLCVVVWESCTATRGAGRKVHSAGSSSGEEEEFGRARGCTPPTPPRGIRAGLLAGWLRLMLIA